MEQLFIDRKGASLDVEAGRLLVRIPDERPISLPLRQLQIVAISASVQLSSRLLLAFDKAAITLTLVNPRQTGEWLVVNGNRHGHVARRVGQYQLCQEEGWMLDAARQIVLVKIRSHYRALLRYRRQRADLRYVLTGALRQLRERYSSALAATSIETLRGVEGAAAAAYFPALAAMFAPHWQFERRARRPPPDPVNALLSLGYSLIYGEAVRALVACGLDPAIGCLHDIAYQRESLACDLVELLRADVDAWVVSLLRSESLRPTHFSRSEGNSCMLNKEGRELFYPLYQAQAHEWRRYLRRIAMQWARKVLADIRVDDGPVLLVAGETDGEG